jgi:outer membrane immunogenic protein
MNRLVEIAAIATLIGAPALAADMAVKAPPPVAAPVLYNWNGFYVGGNVGYSWGRGSNDWNFFGASTVKPADAFICSPDGLAFCASGSDSNKLSGAIGGVQAGYNWQTSNFLAGIETDLQFSGQKGTQTFTAANNAPVSAVYTQKLTWLSTVRGRVGFTADRWLVYATGGLAYGRVTVDGSASTIGQPDCVGLVVAGDVTCPLGSWSNGITKIGWTIGAGVEGAITNNWSWKVEYLHVDLGNVNITFATLPGTFLVNTNPLSINSIAPGTGTISSKITDEIVRVGINYRFGGPVVAKF